MATSWASMSLDERRGVIQSAYQDDHQSLSATLRQELAAIQEEIATAEKVLDQLYKCRLTPQVEHASVMKEDDILKMRDEADTLEVRLKDHEDGFFEGYRSFLGGREYDLRQEMRAINPNEASAAYAEVVAEHEAIDAEWREFSVEEPDFDDPNLTNALCRDLGADI